MAETSRARLAVLLLVAFAAPACVHWRASREYFGGPIGATPASVTVLSGEWRVAEASDLAPGMPGVVQSMQGDVGSIHLCFVENAPFEEGTIDVRFKSVAGAKEQGGGIVWRAKDGGNYYVCHFDPLASMLHIEKVVAGERASLGRSKLELPAGWHHLRVEVYGSEINGLVDGAKRLEVEDSTLEDAGSVGLWTAADAQTLFADFVVLTRS